MEWNTSEINVCEISEAFEGRKKMYNEMLICSDILIIPMGLKLWGRWQRYNK